MGLRITKTGKPKKPKPTTPTKPIHLTLQQFLAIEKDAKNCISTRVSYVVICGGNILAAVVLDLVVQGDARGEPVQATLTSLAKLFGLSRPQVYRAVRWLKKSGLIIVLPGNRKGGVGNLLFISDKMMAKMAAYHQASTRK